MRFRNMCELFSLIFVNNNFAYLFINILLVYNNIELETWGECTNVIENYFRGTKMFNMILLHKLSSHLR